MDGLLKKDETVDDLQNGYYIIQKKSAFRYGVDAVLLSDFAEIRQEHRVVEFGTGTGIIPILLCAKKKPERLIALEIQPDMADMAERSIRLNHLEEAVEIRCMDLKEAPEVLGKAQYDCVITNPPYMKKACGINNPDETKAIARFEIACSLQDVLQSAKALLVPGGKLFMIHRTDRLVDIVYEMRSAGIEPKRLRFVHPAVGKRPNLLLIEGARGGNAELKMMDPLYIYDENGDYSGEIHRIYGRVK